MRIRFDTDFDGYPWPGPLDGIRAVAGHVWTGPQGLLDILETQLGLGGPTYSTGLRTASLLPRLRSTEGFWSQSASADPMGTARTLLRWRDSLWSDGWRGQPASSRLRQLHEIVADLPLGIPDRTTLVIDALARRRVDIEVLELTESRDHYGKLWRQIIGCLEKQGVRIALAEVPEAASNGDLAAARMANFHPRGDGSLQLLRPQGPLEAAELVSAWIGTLNDLPSTLVVTPNATLDLALQKAGLPTQGASGGAGENVLLQILPLVLSLGWKLPDPARAMELLTLPISPVPLSIARRLAAALQQWPAVDSDGWRRELEEGLAAMDDEGRRERVRRRLCVLFRSSVAGDTYSLPELNDRIQTLEVWLAAHSERASIVEVSPSGAVSHWKAAQVQCANLRRMLELSNFDHLTNTQLQRLLEEATSDILPSPAEPAQAGLACVRDPGAVGGSAKNIV